MKRKLIEMKQPYLVQCDNPICNYKVENESLDPNEDISHFLNAPCPKCGENLLTEQDYLTSLKFLKVINWFNKWFSWVMVFVPNKKESGAVTSVHVHKGIHIKEKEL